MLILSYVICVLEVLVFAYVFVQVCLVLKGLKKESDVQFDLLEDKMEIFKEDLEKLPSGD